MLIQVVGRRSFRNNDRNKTYYIVNTMYQDSNCEGWAIKERFVNEDIFAKCVPGHKYEIVFEESFNGRAFIADVKEV